MIGPGRYAIVLQLVAIYLIRLLYGSSGGSSDANGRDGHGGNWGHAERPSQMKKLQGPQGSELEVKATTRSGRLY